MKKVLITGVAGYVGSRLTPQLLKLGYHVTVLDKMFYGQDCLPLGTSTLKVLTADLRKIKDYKMHFKDVDAVIHLGCISNDASFELNESLSRTINFDSFDLFPCAPNLLQFKLTLYHNGQREI